MFQLAPIYLQGNPEDIALHVSPGSNRAKTRYPSWIIAHILRPLSQTGKETKKLEVSSFLSPFGSATFFQTAARGSEQATHTFTGLNLSKAGQHSEPHSLYTTVPPPTRF